MSVVKGSNNLIGLGGSGSLNNGVNGNIVGVANPLIAPLGDYGGFTKTMPLLPGSPAIDAGKATGAPSIDQRGLGRVGVVDIGAFESQGFIFTLVSNSSPQTARVGSAFANPLSVRVTANNPIEPVDGGIVSFAANSAANGASATLPTSAVIGGGVASVAASANLVGGSYTVSITATGVPSVSSFVLTNARATVGQAAVGWGAVGTANLFTATDGLRLLPSGRNIDLPWLDIQRFTITLDAGVTLTAADVSVSGIIIADYGPVTITRSGLTYTITLAVPIDVADRITVTIGNDSIATFTRELDVLPGDVNDDGIVNAVDVALERNAFLYGFPNDFYDITGDGTPTITDYNAVRRKVNSKLPPLR